MSTPVSGPGQFSKRTDKAVGEANRSLPNADYGEQAAYQEQQAGADMAQSQDVTGMNFNDLFGNPASRVTGLAAPSAQPGTPVTDGADLGPGASSAVLPSEDPESMDVEQLKPYMVALQFMADQPNSSTAARNMVRRLQSLS